MNDPFLLGVNYWPRRKAMYWWTNFDKDEVDEEFAQIRELGLNIVRIFLLWDDFQPAPDVVSPTCLNHLRTVCDLAQAHELGLDVTFFTGHMSGPNWAPQWLLHGPPAPNALQLVSGGQVVDSGYHNSYTHPTALAAERLLLTTVVEALRSHPAIWAWNLGNEPDLFAQPPDAATGRAWVAEMTALVRRIDPDHPVTCGLHMDSLLYNNGLRVDDVFSSTDFAVMHAYPMYMKWARGPLDPDVVPFSCALTTALCGKPVLMEEFGGCTAPPGAPSQEWAWTAYGRPRTQFMASEEEFADYIAQVLPRLVEVGATGAFLWCYADYSSDLWQKPPCAESIHERFFGLVRPDGSIKPHAEVIRAFAATRPTVQAASRTVTLPMSADVFYEQPGQHTIALYQEFVSDAT